MADLSGRKALVTGGGRGIGRAISLALAEAGADVAINYRKHSDDADEVAEKIRGIGREARTYQADVSDYDQCKAMVDAAVGDFGSIGILVNNGGIASRGNTVTDTDPAELRRVVATHAFGSANMCALVVPRMRALDRGDVVMISSVATQSLGPRGAPYSMAKAAQEALAHTLAKEERANGIRVNIVAPGLVETEMGRRLVKARRGVDDLREIDADMPFGHVCQPEDIAAAVIYLVGESGRYVTNQRLVVNGGGF